MKKFSTASLGLLFVLIGYSQSVTTSICTWKNDANGAYNFIHDDYGDYGVIGINNYADTMAYNRGLKFTFGAITSSCESNSGMYAQAVDMMNLRGHEMMSHSHNHYCAHDQGWGVCSGDLLWGDNNEFDVQIDQAHQSIITNTGHTPVYYIYPYDSYTESANNHLKTQSYIGARTGSYDAIEQSNFTPDADGFFRTALVVDATATAANNLNYWVDLAISSGGWANREMHNVGNSGWGRISITNYRDHLDYLKTKVDAGELWVGTISEILTYQIQKLNYTPTGSYNLSTDRITVGWNTPAFDVKNYLAPLTFKSPVTIKIDLSNLSSLDNITVSQNGVITTDYTIDGFEMLLNAYPHKGSIYVDATDQLVGIGNNNTDTDLEVFPNPFKESFYINLESNITEATYTLSDINGNEIESGKLQNNQNFTPEQSLKNGTYILQVKYNSSVKNIQIIKQ